jgi:hypothetical protein
MYLDVTLIGGFLVWDLESTIFAGHDSCEHTYSLKIIRDLHAFQVEFAMRCLSSVQATFQALMCCCKYTVIYELLHPALQTVFASDLLLLASSQNYFWCRTGSDIVCRLF